MTGPVAAKLALRNQLIAALEQVDTRLGELARQDANHRVVSEFRQLVELRADIADQLRDLNAEPAPLPNLKDNQ